MPTAIRVWKDDEAGLSPDENSAHPATFAVLIASLDGSRGFLTAKPFSGDFLLLLFGSGNGNQSQGERDHTGLRGEIPAPPPSFPQGFLVPVE